ncbi:MAG: hypothetical protein IBJ12_09585 [Sphingomonadaceae bacterium]|nr:hypothetical protein [Sphingomonadaceae bacterium]
MRFLSYALILGAVTMSCAASVQADLSASPFGVVETSADDATRLEMPKLEFAETPEDAKNYDKYYFFRRDETDFATAYADISECDGYARGLVSSYQYQDPPYPYAGTLAGAAGGMIANAMMAAIFVPGEKRRMRRVNMRQCMGFKGYERLGLSKDLWEAFNFEEGTGVEEEESRTRALKLQALVASTAPATEKVLPR